MIHQPVRCLPAPIGNSGFFLKQIVKNFFADNHCIWDYIVFIRKENIYAISKCLTWFPFQVISENMADVPDQPVMVQLAFNDGSVSFKRMILFLKKREYYDVVHNKL